MVNTDSKSWPIILMRVTLAVSALALVLGGLVAVGNLARDTLGPADRYRVDFMSIECSSPKGKTRENFLGEVQYNGRFSDDLSVLDPSLPDKLRVAFARHQSVDEVVKITVRPPKRIIVELKFRPESVVPTKPE